MKPKCNSNVQKFVFKCIAAVSAASLTFAGETPAIQRPRRSRDKFKRRILFMIEDLKSEGLYKRYGGQFRLTALVQRRLKELVEGARPLVDPTGKNLVGIAIEEVAQNKITIDYEHTEDLPAPKEYQPTKTEEKKAFLSESKGQ